MKDNKAHARGWFLKAESDLSAAQQVLAGEGPYDTACFHAQQSIEKLLKGFLAYKNGQLRNRGCSERATRYLLCCQWCATEMPIRTFHG